VDDPIGTQAPSRRFEDPLDALAEFQNASPGLAALRRTEPAAVDWAVIESDLGTALPPDFKLLSEHYRSLTIGDSLAITSPRPGRERPWVRAILEELEIVGEWCEDTRLEPPTRPFPSPGGLLPWGATDWGDYVLWTTNGPPAEWTITVATRGGGWWHFAGGLVQFLTGLVDGSVEQWGLHTIAPAVTSDDPSCD
jgi:hypothetical protein